MCQITITFFTLEDEDGYNFPSYDTTTRCLPLLPRLYKRTLKIYGQNHSPDPCSLIENKAHSTAPAQCGLREDSYNSGKGDSGLSAPLGGLLSLKIVGKEQYSLIEAYRTQAQAKITKLHFINLPHTCW
jgi:hypothetical protein